MTTNELVEGILVREGGFVNHPDDRGGATNWGITAQTWGTYLGLGRMATAEEIAAISRDQAAVFYRDQYVLNSPFRVVGYEPLRVQLIDFAILSGTERATRWLQRVLDVPVTGHLDERTLGALARDRGPLVNRALVAGRVGMFQALVEGDRSQAVFLRGWIGRAMSFLTWGEEAAPGGDGPTMTTT